MNYYKRCVNCKELQRTKEKGKYIIGFCKITGIDIKDTLSGCIKSKKAITIVNNKV